MARVSNKVFAAEKADVTISASEELLVTPQESDIKLNDETPQEVKVQRTNGTVRNCGVLNVRKTPSSKADILSTLKRGDSVLVDLEGSTATYYRVLIKGVEGFCVKEFIGV
jgi:uncharacterized protein YgiM (DUF1202 family)